MSIVNKIESISSHLENAYGSLEDIGADLSHINKNIENLSIVLDTVYDSMPKINEEGTNLTLNNTRKGKMSNVLKGNLSQKTSILPSEYTQVDYIESSGTQYIDTSVNADSKLRVVLDMSYSVSPVNMHMGAIYNHGSGWYTRYHFDAYEEQWRGYYDTLPYSFGTSDLNRHIFDFDAPNKVYKVDDVSSPTFSYTAFDTQLNFWLFGRNSNYDSYKIYNSSKLYSCQMYYNNELVRDFIPCYRKSDNVVGLYDIVNDVFYTNQGTGDFTYGSVAGIPNPDYPQDVEVVSGDNSVNVCGKNLFDKDNANILNASIQTNKNIATSANARTLYISCKPNTTYTITKLGTRFRLGTTSETPTIGNLCIDYVANDSASTLTIKTSVNVNYLLVYYYLATSDTLTEQQVLDSIQIEEGTSATTYEPYQSQSYPINLGDIELCKIGDYQDRIYKDNGKWYIEKQIGKVVLNGSESWGSASSIASGTLRFWYQNNNVFNSKIEGDLGKYVVSCSFKGISWQGMYYDNTITKNAISNYTASNMTGGRIQIRIDNTIANDVSTFKTWLSTHNTTVYYVLATLTNTEITDQTLIAQLDNFEKAKSYNNQTNISQENNDLPFIINATALMGNSD